MIFATVGTHYQSFERFVRAVDALAGSTGEEVIIQRGATPLEPAHAQAFTYASASEIEALMRSARVVLTHAGAGSLMMARAVARAIVVVPRVKRFGEMVDDHQLELADALERLGWVAVVRNVGDLPAAIERAPILTRRGDRQGKQALVVELRGVLSQMAAKARPGR